MGPPPPRRGVDAGRLHYTGTVPAAETRDTPVDRPQGWRGQLRPIARCTARALGEALLCLGISTTTLMLAYPHVWWLIRARTLVRVRDIYRPGDYGGTLFLITRALEGETGHRSQLLAYPDGFAFRGDFTNQTLTDGMSWVVRLVGMPLGYNLSVVGMLATNGLAVYLAARLLKVRLLAALSCAAIATIAPLVTEEVLSGRPVSSWWGPAIAATALCVAATRSWERLWLAVPGLLCLAVAVKVYAYAPILLLPWTVLAGLVALWPLDRWRLLRAGLVVVVAAGVAWWAIQETLRVGPGGYLGSLPSLRHSSLSLKDLLDLGGGGEDFIRIPAVTLLVALAASAIGWRRFRFWLPAALGGLLLVAVAMGTDPQARGELADVDPWMPYTWLMYRVPWLWGCPRPTRYGMPGALLLALWMGIALSALWHGRHRAWPWVGRVVSVAALAGMLAQVHHTDNFAFYSFWPPLPQLEAVRGDRVLLDVPLAFHGDKAIFSMVAYAPVPRLNPPSVRYREWLEQLDRDEWPLMTALAAIHGQETVPDEALAAIREGPREVRELGLRHVVLHRTQIDASAQARYEALMAEAGATIVSDGEMLTIYELR